MEKLQDQAKVEQHVEAYSRQYSVIYDPSGIYDLHREWESTTIPHADKPGVYAFYSAQGELLYIGKVSLNHTLGRRVCSYFKFDKIAKKLSEKDDGWTERPAYLQTFRVDNAYEAPSLEEYLLEKLRPCNNTQMRAAE